MTLEEQLTKEWCVLNLGGVHTIHVKNEGPAGLVLDYIFKELAEYIVELHNNSLRKENHGTD